MKIKGVEVRFDELKQKFICAVGMLMSVVCFGIMGMILAVPAVTILQKVVQILLDHRQSMRSRAAAETHIQKIIV